MKNYLIQRTRSGVLLTAESLVKGKVVRTVPNGPFSIGDKSKESLALAAAVMEHYYGVPQSGLPGKMEAARQAKPFFDAFLAHHKLLALNSKLEISSDVIDRFMSLRSSLVLG